MLPDHAPFSPQQKQSVEGLIATLSPEQQSWLSAYLAGLSTSVAPVATAPATKPKVTVLYGTESGNSESLADQTSKRLKGAGYKPKVVNMADYDVALLPKEEVLLTICSTWGDGDPPADAEPFFDALMAEDVAKMEHTRFSVLGLGDTSYEKFCQCGKDLDSRFVALGAQRLSDRVDSDVEFDKPFEDWLGAIEKALGAGAAPVTAVATTTTVASPAVEYTKKNPFPSPVLERVNLNGAGSAKETIHVELGLEGSGLTYKPGDALGVVPTNAPELIEDFLKATGLKAEDSWNGSPLGDQLVTDFDIRTLSKTFAKKYAKAAGNSDLDALLNDAEKLDNYMWGREIPDLIQDYPAKSTLELPQMMELLRGLTPRLYSIASSLKAHPDEVHLTVGVVRYLTGERLRGGICSTYLADRCGDAINVPTYIHTNKNFFLPEDTDTPIIMVGPGTGIAPFRAFIEERAAIGAQGKSWLFFGDQHFATDFLYQLEWQDYFKSGDLTKIDLAFSRDTAQKVYVQHRMQERAKDLYAWLEEGAYFYVCGDASRMAKDVHNTLIDVVAQESGKSREDAEAYVKALQKEKRYQRDVY
ncbi:MAG: assimilatory sulfite reductase (NADPH) flavoprotein subunit [Opitutales bacterium]|nr:assimilatory sulfite reductase (NADPH) flavoprotein subunit [Opitutales bacterium]